LSDSMCLCCGVHESEDVVQDVEASVIALELESLCEAHGLVLASKQKGTGHEDKNAIVSRRLRIYGVGAVLNSLEWQVLKLLYNSSDTLSSLCLKGEHRSVPIEGSETSAIFVKGLEVELHELLGNGVEVGHLGGDMGLFDGRTTCGELLGGAWDGRIVCVGDSRRCFDAGRWAALGS